MRVRNKCILTTTFTTTLVLIACAVLFSVAPAAPVLAAGAAPAGVALAPTPIAPKEATTTTAQINAALLEELPFADQQDFEDAQRGFIATLPEVVIKADDGHTVWSLKGYEFLDQEEPPPSINPSLWRMAQLNMNNGLFEVTDRIYQVRGFDVSNMTIIEGDTGLILIDPLSTAETARAGLDLYYQERGEKPVVAVIYTHSHVDHYAGVKGVITEEDVAAGKVTVLAPDGFLDAAVSENVFRRQCHEPSRRVSIWPVAPRGRAGPGRRRPWQSVPPGRHHADCTDRHDLVRPGRRGRSTASRWSSRWSPAPKRQPR